MLKKWRYPIGGVVVLVALVVLLFSVWQHSDAFLLITELKGQGESVYGEKVNVIGEVSAGSTEYDVENRMLTFTITGEGESLAVVYEGTRPSNFDDGVEVVVEGNYNSTGIFHADEIITKCPSKYEPAE